MDQRFGDLTYTIYDMTATNFGHGQGCDRGFLCVEGNIDVGDGSNIQLKTVYIVVRFD